MPTRDHDEAMAEYYSLRPETAVSMINDLLLDGEAGELGHLLKQLRIAFPPQTGATGVESSLESIFASEGNATLRDLTVVLRTLGRRLAVVRAEDVSSAAADAELDRAAQEQISPAA